MRRQLNQTQRDLIAKGWLTNDLRLTEAGNAYVDQLMDDLRAGKFSAPVKRKRVKWLRRGGPKPAAFPQQVAVDQQHSTLAL